MWMVEPLIHLGCLRAMARHGFLHSRRHFVPSSLIDFMAHAAGYFHLHLISDATGETLITVARAAAAQYANVSPVEHLYPMARTKRQLDNALAEITESPGLVLYTLLEEDLIESLEKKCRDLALPCMSVLGPVLRLFQSYLGAETIHR